MGKKTKLNDTVTVLGGEEVEVTLRDGQTERVQVRQIPISLMGRFSFALNNEAAAIELYCDKADGWADSLAPESVNAVADKGLEINLPFFSAWWKRQARWTEVTRHGEIAEMKKKLNELIASRLASSAGTSPTTTS